MWVLGKIKVWLAIAGGVLLALVGVYAQGRYAGGRTAKAKAVGVRLRDVGKSRRVEDEIETMDDEHLARLASKYVRGYDQ